MWILKKQLINTVRLDYIGVQAKRDYSVNSQNSTGEVVGCRMKTFNRMERKPVLVN